jgi:hypothetical protein
MPDLDAKIRHLLAFHAHGEGAEDPLAMIERWEGPLNVDLHTQGVNRCRRQVTL